MIEKPYAGRAKISHDGRKLVIRIPSKKNWLLILFLTVWMGGWFMGELFAIQDLLSGDHVGIDFFTLIWLIGWTIGGVFISAVLLWSVLGQETIVVERRFLSLSKGLKDFGLRKRSYDLRTMDHLELNHEPNKAGNYGAAGVFFGLIGGKIRFDYGMRTIKFGAGIDEAEARHLIDLIKARYSEEYG